MANENLSDQSYTILRKKLIDCEYRPGTMLTETKLSEDLSFSRTPIRAALNRLEYEGFVKIIPKKGVYVTDISLEDVTQIFQTRLEIEPVALRMAGPNLPKNELLNFKELLLGEEPDIKVAFRLDTAMHLFIIEHCGNRFIIDMMRKVFDKNTRIIISSKQNHVKIHDARKEHIEIIDLLLKEDIKEAQRAMYAHIKNCQNAAFDFFRDKNTFAIKTSNSYKSELESLFDFI